MTQETWTFTGPGGPWDFTGYFSEPFAWLVPGTEPYPLPVSPTTLVNVIPSYPYIQYNDDASVQAFVQAFNQMAQQYVNTFNQLNLPIYTSNTIVGPLLDWVATGLYGYPRPGLPTAGITAKGPYNTYAYNSAIAYGGNTLGENQTFTATSDDIYKRCLTWAFYKGDGKQFNIPWLKRRIVRFLTGANGTAPDIDSTYNISITFTGAYAATITIATTTISTILKAGVVSGALQLPFQIDWTVTLT